VQSAKQNFRYFFLTVLYSLIFTESVVCDTITVNFNQTLIEQSTLNGVDLNNRDRVLDLVLNQMPSEIMVYPSEGYYYFSFLNNGEWIKGNLRFDKTQRDKGEVYFVYYKDIEKTPETGKTYFYTLHENNGVTLKKISPFSYKLSFKGIHRTVRIYDAHYELSHKPILPEYEEYIGPIFDDSGVRFHFIYDHKAHTFLYVLNSDLGYSETFRSIDSENRILIGTRSKFAFYHDRQYRRMLLVGVYKQYIDQNNHYDGPFDQLPDSFMDGEHFRNILEEYDPSLIGALYPYGVYKNEPESRYAVIPYMEYSDESELYKTYICTDKPQHFTLNQCLFGDISK